MYPISRFAWTVLTSVCTVWVVVAVSFAGMGACVRAAEPPADLTSACTEDAKRVCSWAQLIEASTGHYGGISTCFVHHRAKLSPSCRSMLVKYGYNK